MILRLSFIILLLLFQTAHAQEEMIDIRILSKFHPTVVRIETEKRIFRFENAKPESFQFAAPPDEDIVVTVNGEISRTYRGVIRVQWDGAEYRIDNSTPLEFYVAGVVIGELGAGAALELLKAQAILARSFALNTRRRGPLSDLAYHQVFPGFDSFAQKIYPHTSGTHGLVLQSRNKLADVLYHAECGSNIYGAGAFWKSATHQAAMALPPEVKKGAVWSVSLSDQQIRKVFPDATQLTKLDSTPVMMDLGSRRIEIEAFRLAINREFGWNTIPSNEFSLQRQGSGWQLSGRGRGHLVGMCQVQAGELAQQGWKYREIIGLYYPEFTILPFEAMK